MIKCENCNSLNKGEYGSGRFCSSKCARGFSTKRKRKEINKKVSLKMFGSGNPDIIKICKACSENFTIDYPHRDNVYCSVKCSKSNISEETRLKISKKISYIRSLGKFSFNSIRCKFRFKNKYIRCDSQLEYNGLTKICNEFEVFDINRSSLILPYIYENRIRHFNPDFEIILKNGSIIILECKCSISLNNTNKQSRPLYFLTIEQKMTALKNYCILQGYQCWLISGRKLIQK